MVSPLRIWQHPEPKGLWPALGGLAVVAHVGVIGLSLPYVAGLVGGAGGSAAAVVPVELVVDADTESTLVKATEPARGNNTPASTPASEQSTQKSDPVQSIVPDSPVKRSPAEAAETPISQPPIEEPSPIEEKTNQVKEDSSGSEAPSSDEVTEKETSEAEETQEPTRQNEAKDASPPTGNEAETTSPEETPSNEEEDLTTLDGQQLSPPGQASTSEGRDQVAALSFTRYNTDAVPKDIRKDPFVTTPPEPTQIASINERPQDLGCAEVGELPPMPLTYRVTISETGTIQTATPWTGSLEVASPLNESEAAIECLLKQSGWRFTPALDNEGAAYPFSDGLLTFTLGLQTD